MKYLLSTLVILFVTVNVQAQHLYFDGSGSNYVETAHIGAGWDVGNDFTFRFYSGFAQSQARGHYMDVGVGLERVIPLTLIGAIKPVAGVDLRGYSGENHIDKSAEGLDSGISYGLFAGLNYHKISLGLSVMQHPFVSSDFHIDPLTVRLSL